VGPQLLWALPQPLALTGLQVAETPELPQLPPPLLALLLFAETERRLVGLLWPLMLQPLALTRLAVVEMLVLLHLSPGASAP